jgi:hypothetical protein
MNNINRLIGQDEINKSIREKIVLKVPASAFLIEDRSESKSIILLMMYHKKEISDLGDRKKILINNEDFWNTESVLRDFKDIFIMGIVVNELIKSGKNIPYEWNIRIHIEVLSNNLFKHDQTDRMNQLSHLKLNEIFNIWETGIVSESLWDDYE